MKTRMGFQQLCAVTALLALVSAQMAPAQQAGLPANGTHALTAAAAAQEEEGNVLAAGKQGGDGIKIHGHWKFVVHDPDGKLVSEREFENSLLTPTQGDQVLQQLLFGGGVVADWAIVLCGTSTVSDPAAPPAGGGLIGAFCSQSGNGSTSVVVALVSQTQSGIGSGLCTQGAGAFTCTTGLQTSAPTVAIFAGIADTLVLAGNYTATAAGSIQAVQTGLALCIPTLGSGYGTISPKACAALSYIGGTAASQSNGNTLFVSPFTGTNLVTPQALTAGQILTVTVTFSFS